jgi:hypothetical protein
MVIYKRKRLKKGVSPTISNLILLVAVIGTGLFLWWFALTRTNIAAADYADEVSEGIEKIEERFVIEHVQIQNTSEIYNITIWVHNYGKISVNITDIYLESTRNLIPNGQVIDIGGLQSFTLNCTQFVQDNNRTPDFVQVQSKRGSVVIGKF